MNFRVRVLDIVWMAVAFGAIAWAQSAPTSLAATTATKNQVVLRWTSTDGTNTFIVQRRVLGGSFTTLQSVTAATATDNTVDPYTTYQYQIIATNGATQSVPSGSITVGPPPEGFNIVSPGPPNVGDASNYGRYPRMVLDQNGDPAIAFYDADPNGDNNYSDTRVSFVNWSRTAYKWNTPVRIATTGDSAAGSGAVTNMSLARDASTNLFGVAYVVVTGSAMRVDYATSSDNGATWRTQPVISDPQSGFNGPSLAMAGGQAYLAYYHDFSGIQYAKGSETAAPNTWTTQKVPLPATYTEVRRNSSLALDSAGNPGLAFIAGSEATDAEVFWRPGAATAIVAATNDGRQNDDPDVQLAFAGTQPRILFYGARDSNFFADYDHQLWAIRSTDTGNTWAPGVPIASDGNTSLQGPSWLDFGSAGQAAAVLESNGGNLDGVMCGGPKLARSTNFVSWSMCGPAPLFQPNFRASAPVVRFGANDKLWISFQVAAIEDLAPGVVVWREPLSSSGSSPQISAGGIINAASFTANIAPGSLATIFGSNFATFSDAASSLPLPTNLSGIVVTVNGRAAPLVYAGVNQINFQVPYETAVGTASVVVSANGKQSAPANATIAAVAPGIFVFNNTRAVIQNQDFSVNDTNNPAKVGSSVVLYATGQGALDNAVPTGAGAPNSPLSRPRQAVTATIGGTPATVAFAGLTPGFVGLLQVNLTIPAKANGNYPIVITQGGVASNGPQITISQ